MKISIIVPIFKVETYLRDCIDSVLAQTYKDFELILVDDGSPDSCPVICDEYVKMDNRIKVIHKSNGGLSDARNCGLKLASGDYVIFLDSDDYYLSKDFLNAVVEGTNDGTVDAVFFQRTILYDDPSHTIKKLPLYNMGWNGLSVGGVLLELVKHDRLDASACMKATKREVLLSNNLFFTKGIYSEDIEWFSRYVQCLNTVSLINKPDYCYRKRVGSISNTLKEKNVRDLFYTLQLHSKNIRDGKLNQDIIKVILAYHSYQYYIILGLANNVLQGSTREAFFTECQEYKWLIEYSIGPKTKLCAFIVRLFGLKLSGRIFGRYIKLKV